REARRQDAGRLSARRGRGGFVDRDGQHLAAAPAAHAGAGGVLRDVEAGVAGRAGDDLASHRTPPGCDTPALGGYGARGFPRKLVRVRWAAYVVRPSLRSRWGRSSVGRAV